MAGFGVIVAIFLGNVFLMAGCVGQGEEVRVEGADASLDEVDVAPYSVAELGWQGRLVLGAADEIPAHMDETEPLTHSAMNKSFQVEVSEVPESVDVRVDWDSPAAWIMLMVVEPEGQGPLQVRTVPVNPVVPGKHYYASEGPLCIHLPTETMQTGMWMVMVHSAAAVDATLDFTVTVRGGAARIVDEPSTLSGPDLVEAAATQKNPAPTPCG